MSILEKLFNGKVSPFNDFNVKTPEYNKINKEISNYTEIFKEKLSEDDFSLLNDLCDAMC